MLFRHGQAGRAGRVGGKANVVGRRDRLFSAGVVNLGSGGMVFHAL